MNSHLIPPDVLFESGNIKVTREAARFGETTYPLRNIASYRIAEVPPARPIYPVLFSAILLLVGFHLILGVGKVASYWPVVGMGSVGGGLWLLIRAIWPRRVWSLLLGTSAGEAQACISKDRELLKKIEAAMHQAITRS
jgi:hypothetical protein